MTRFKNKIIVLKDILLLQSPNKVDSSNGFKIVIPLAILSWMIEWPD
jgi:hypothetical protein